MIFETWLNCDLQKPVKVERLIGNLFSADIEGNKIGVIIKDGGEDATITGNVLGYVIRHDGKTVVVQGTLSGNKASIILPASCYVVVGPVSIVIKVDSATVGACTGYVYQTTTDEIVDPGGLIPSLSELLDQIAACEAATDAANAAAVEAIEIAEERCAYVNEKIDLISRNLLNPRTVALQRSIASDGSFPSRSGYYRSAYIPVTAGNQYWMIWHEQDDLPITYSAFYDEDKVFIAGSYEMHINSGTTNVFFQVTAPAGAYYMVVSAPISYDVRYAMVSLYEGNTIQYQPYFIYEMLTDVDEDLNTAIDGINDKIGTVPTGTTLEGQLGDLKSAFALHAEEIDGTTQTITFDSSGNVSQIVHAANGAAVRTDVFTFGTNTITEVRTLNTGESLTIVTNTETLVTTVTYAAAA